MAVMGRLGADERPSSIHGPSGACSQEKRPAYRRERFGATIGKRLADERGQMMVELCVVFPVAIVIALIAVNALTFFGDCARFDRLAHNSIRVASSSPSFSLSSADQIGEEVLAQLDDGMAEGDLDINMNVSVTAENYMRYEMELVYHPTLFGLSMRSEIFGVSLPSLSHKIEYTVDPYRAGAFL